MESIMGSYSCGLGMSCRENFIKLAVDSEALAFGEFELKSGRKSPYFLNLGKFYSGAVLSRLATNYAQTIIDKHIEFDVIFGPAYKGISLSALAVAKIAEIEPKLGCIEYAYNRKEVKDHGEGGSLVGAPLKGRRVLIIDDVITAGTAAREAVKLIQNAGGEVAGIVVAVDRQEKLPGSNLSTLQELATQYGMPVFSIVTFSDIIEVLRSSISKEQLQQMEEYKREYGATK